MTQKAKGPAATGIAPDLVQTPAKGFKNMQSNNTSPRHAAIESDWNLCGANCYFSGNSMLNHSLAELMALQDVVSTFEDVMGGFQAQPRFWDTKTKGYNNAGRTLESLVLFIEGVRCLIVNTAKSVIPATPLDADRRAWIILQHECKYGENLHDFANLVSGLSASVGGMEGDAA